MTDDILSPPESGDSSPPESGDSSPPESGDSFPPESGERIAKRLARAGLCSRREAERWIGDGRVVVNGVVLASPAVVVSPRDLIVVDGRPVAEPERTRLWRYHKPAGLVTTHRDPEGRPTVFAALPADLPRVVSVGRLDLNSEGLMLLTNDGALARRLELPSNAWVRRYRVRVHGEVDPAALLRLDRGVTIDGETYGSIKATLDRQKGANAWLTVSLAEGKNREIRRVMDYLGWPVTRLIRVAYGPFQLGTLEEGAVDEVPGKVLREQLGGAKPVLRPKADTRPAGERAKAERLKTQEDKDKEKGRGKARGAARRDGHHPGAKGKTDANRRRTP